MCHKRVELSWIDMAGWLVYVHGFKGGGVTLVQTLDKSNSALVTLRYMCWYMLVYWYMCWYLLVHWYMCWYKP